MAARDAAIKLPALFKVGIRIAAQIKATGKADTLRRVVQKTDIDGHLGCKR